MRVLAAIWAAPRFMTFGGHMTVKFTHSLLAVAIASLLAPQSALAASVINFEEFPAMNVNGTLPANAYSSLGVTFAGTDDGSTFGGIAAGDPGSWGLLGTNGSTFMGFNGSSYSLSMLFATAIGTFSLDAARSGGSSNGIITITGLLNGNIVGSNSVTLGGINQWSTLSLAGNFDRVDISGAGSGFHPFGIDNVRFDGVQSAVPEPATWATMLLGFGLIGGAMRYRRRPKVVVRYG